MDWVSPPPPPLSLAKYESKISPSILLIIVILSVIFFISGILHLLVRFLLRPTIREAEDSENGTVLQGQLQDLFHLHDAGVDQSFIDTLPIFLYKAIIGLKDPFDCAVCLSEFEPKDKLRLLPNCSHAFHVECIDTWLLSHSTCPLCRRSLFPLHNSLLVLESGTESSREFVPSNSEETGSSFGQKSDLFIKDEIFRDENVVPIKLGRFTGGGGEGSSNGSRNLEQSERRCFSMGSYDYVMNENCVLQVSLASIKKKKKKISACNILKRESFSASKIWLQRSGDLKKSGFYVGEEWEKSGSEVDLDLENSFCSQIEKTPSFARRTLMWIVGRQNKVGSNQ